MPIEQLTLIGGKMKNPLWDSDISHEGGTGQSQAKFDPVNVFVNVSGFVLNEFSSDDDPWMFPIQGGVDLKIADFIGVKVSGTYYIFTNLDKIDVKARGNYSSC